MHLEDVPLGHAVCKVSFRCIHAYEESFERFFGLLDGVRAPSVAITRIIKIMNMFLFGSVFAILRLFSLYWD